MRLEDGALDQSQNEIFMQSKHGNLKRDKIAEQIEQ
jgi:hypothetical protein